MKSYHVSYAVYLTLLDTPSSMPFVDAGIEAWNDAPFEEVDFSEVAFERADGSFIPAQTHYWNAELGRHETYESPKAKGLTAAQVKVAMKSPDFITHSFVSLDDISTGYFVVMKGPERNVWISDFNELRYWK